MDKAMTASSQDWDAKAAELLSVLMLHFGGIVETLMPLDGESVAVSSALRQAESGRNNTARQERAVAAALREAYQQGRRDQADEVIQAAALSKRE